MLAYLKKALNANRKNYENEENNIERDQSNEKFRKKNSVFLELVCLNFKNHKKNNNIQIVCTKVNNKTMLLVPSIHINTHLIHKVEILQK